MPGSILQDIKRLARQTTHHPAMMNPTTPITLRGALLLHIAMAIACPVTPVFMAAAQDPPARDTARRPVDDAGLRYWLENMLRFHRYSLEEVSTATGLTPGEVSAAIDRLHIDGSAPAAPGSGELLRVMPYPGGRHPRIGFLEGAIAPQRETKVSVFTPWDPASYVVVDVPEAIWSNLGLTYLAHTHIPTVWDARGETLEVLEWQRLEGGVLRMERRLPNGIVFGTRVEPRVDHVAMEMWLTNGSGEPLSDLRVQNCVMLKAAKGFELQSNDNKVLRQPLVAASNGAGDRWILSGWEPCHRAWANPPVPCLHSDPRFPDCPPGETRTLRGWLSFYEGTDIDGEIARVARVFAADSVKR